MSHLHYGKEVQEALSVFQELYATYMNFVKVNPRENTGRFEVVQLAWDNFVRARKRETGIGYYLNENQFAVNSK